ncbi:MAG: glycine oxidase ThiO [Zetaproteobacteria bacterium]|nr:glycine oxidase ThiO [Zetaproteobacteria bacterium]
MKVIVIGGGIIGCLTACFLKQRGADVVVLERGNTGQEASWAGAGILCPIHPWLYPDDFSYLVDASLALYPDLQATLMEETGIDPQWVQSGLMIPLLNDDVIHHRDAALAWSKKFAWHVEVLNAQEAMQYEPSLNPEHLQGALRWKDVAQIRNPRLLQAVRVWMKKLGVVLHEQCEVKQLLASSSGKVIGVQSSDGSNYHADAVLLSGGSWSGELAKSMGFSLPVQPVKGQMVLLKGRPNLMQHIIKHDDAYFVPRKDGRILVGASMEFVGFERGNTDDVIQSLLISMKKIAPALENLEIEQQWMGFRPGTPDGMPFLGKIPEKEGLWVATGHYRNGVALAPITAQVMSQSILGESLGLDLTSFTVQRSMPKHSIVGFPQPLAS